MVGAVDEATIKAYIEDQKWDEDDESFKITAPAKAVSRLCNRAPSGGLSRNATFSRNRILPSFSAGSHQHPSGPLLSVKRGSVQVEVTTRNTDPMEQFERELRAAISSYQDDAEWKMLSSRCFERLLGRKYVYSFAWLGRPSFSCRLT